MRRMWKGWVAALAITVLTGTVCTAQPAAARKDMAASQAWWGELFGRSKPPAPTGETPRDEPEKPRPVDPVEAEAPALPKAAERAERHRLVMEAMERRQRVIDRLREIADETNDAALAEEATRLEDMAREIYTRESGRILGVATTEAGGPAPVQGRGATQGSPDRSAGLQGRKR